MFYACETDDFLKDSPTAVNANQEHSRITQLSFKDIKSNPMLLKLITQLKSKNISGNITQRGEFNNTFQMELDTAQIFKVESEWRHSYTFRIIEDTIDANITRNLVLSYAGNYNSYYAYITSYDLSEQEKLDIKLGNPVDLNSKITMQTYNPNYTTFSNVLEDNSDCFENIQIGGDICPEGIHNIGQMNDGDCWYVNNGTYTPSTFPIYEVLVSFDCLDSGGSTGDPINDDPIAWEPTEPIDGPGGGGPRDGEVTINNPSDPPDDSGNDDSEQEDPFLDAPETVINIKDLEIDCNTFEGRIDDLLDTEAGFVNDPVDPGGATNKGISWPVWKENANNVLGVQPTLQNLQNLTESQAKLIYKEKYWEPIFADDIDDGDLRWILFDFYVNSGGNAVKVLQRTLNELGENVTVDGVMGALTLSKINNFSDINLLYNTFKTNRQQYYNDITDNSVQKYLDKNPNATQSDIENNTFKKFINGWTNRVDEFQDKTSEKSKNVNC